MIAKYRRTSNNLMLRHLLKEVQADTVEEKVFLGGLFRSMTAPPWTSAMIFAGQHFISSRVKLFTRAGFFYLRGREG